MTLEECLQQLPWRTIAAIAQALALPYTHRHGKSTLCARLAAAIMEPERWQATWRALSPEARAALRALSEADGLMCQEAFTARFGSIRPYKPWRDDAPVAPWENPASPAEELAYRGLVFVVNQGSKRRPLWVVVLPDEIKACLTPPPAPLSEVGFCSVSSSDYAFFKGFFAHFAINLCLPTSRAGLLLFTFDQQTATGIENPGRFLQCLGCVVRAVKHLRQQPAFFVAVETPLPLNAQGPGDRSQVRDLPGKPGREPVALLPQDHAHVVDPGHLQASPP